TSSATARATWVGVATDGPGIDASSSPAGMNPLPTPRTGSLIQALVSPLSAKTRPGCEKILLRSLKVATARQFAPAQRSVEVVVAPPGWRDDLADRDEVGHVVRPREQSDGLGALGESARPFGFVLGDEHKLGREGLLTHGRQRL